MKVISIDGDTSLENKIDKKGFLKDLSVGTHTVKYQVIDSHGNKDEFTTTFEIKKASDKSKHPEDIIQKTVYSAPRTDHIKATAINRGDNYDRQQLGVQLDPGQNITVKLLSAPEGSNQELVIESLTDNQRKDVRGTVKKDAELNLQAKTDDEIRAEQLSDSDHEDEGNPDHEEVSRTTKSTTKASANKTDFRGDLDDTGIVFIKTPRNKKDQNSEQKTYEIEYTVGHDVRDVPYWHTGDDEALFFDKWEAEDKKYTREAYKLNNTTGAKESTGQKAKGFAVIDSQDMMLLPPSVSRTSLAKTYDKTSADYSNNRSNNIKTLNDLMDRYELLMKQYDKGIGLEENPDNPVHERVRSKYFGRADGNGVGSAYYGGSWIAKNGVDLNDFYVDMGWGTFHEVGHGYQGMNKSAPNVGLGETTNNILGYFAQHTYDIAGYYNRYWMDLDDDADQKLKERNEYFQKNLQNTEDEFYRDNIVGSLYVLLSAMESINSKNPQQVWADVNADLRQSVADGNSSRKMIDALFEYAIEKKNLDLTPYFMEWGFSRPTINDESIEKQRQADHAVMLSDVVTDPDQLKLAMQRLRMRKTAVVSTKQLERLNIQGKAKFKIEGVDLETIKGKKAIIMNDGKVVKSVPITSLDMEVDLPVGAYSIYLPVLDDKGYEYTQKPRYIYSTDQYKSSDSTVKDKQYTMVGRYTARQTQKTLSKDSFVVLGENEQNKLDDAFNLQIFPRADRPTVEFKINLDDKVKAKDQTKIEVHTQLVAGSNFFMGTPDVTYTAAKGEPFKLQGKDSLRAISNNDIIAVTTTKENMENVRTYSELGNEYVINRPKEETTYYYVNNTGFREVHLSQEAYNKELAEQELTKIANELREKIKQLRKEDIDNKYKAQKLKSDILFLYYQLDSERQKEFTATITAIKAGAKPTLYMRDAIENDKVKKTPLTLSIEEGQEDEIDWKKQFIALDAEDAYIELDDDNSSIKASKKRLTKPNHYQIDVTVKDSDNNETTAPVDVEVIPKKDFEENHVAEAKKAVDEFDFLSDDEQDKVDAAIDKAYVAQDIREIVTEAQTENNERLEKAQTEAKAYVDKIKDVNTEENKTVDEKIDAAKSKASLTTIVKTVKEKVKDRVTKAYDQSKASVESDKELTKEERQKALEALDKIQTVAAANKIKEDVTNEGKKRLDANKAKAKSEINGYDQLSQEQKEEANKAIDDVKQSSDLKAIVDQAKDYQDKETAKDLEAAKAKAEELVKHADTLSEDDKEAVNKAIKEAKTTKEVAEISKKVVEAQKERMNTAKKEAKEYVGKIKDLSDKEKKTVDEKIESAESKASLTNIVKTVKEKITTRVTEAYDKAKESVIAEQELTADENQKALAALEKIETVDAANKIKDEVAKEGQKRLADNKEKAKKEINSYTKLSQEQKTATIAAIDKVKQSLELKEIVDAAKAYHDEETSKDLAAAKTKAKELVKNADALSDQDKEENNKAIDEATSKEDVAKIAAKVVELQEERVNAAKEKTFKSLEKADLTDEEMAKFKAALESADTIAEVKQAGEFAKDRHDHNLAEVKKLAKDFVETLVNIEDNEKTTLTKTVEGAKSYSAVRKALTTAVEEDKKRLTEAKDEATKAIESYASLKDKKPWQEAVKNASSVKEVKEIHSYAQQVNDWYKNDLTDAKAKAKEEVAKLSGLTDEQIQKVKDAIDKADKAEKIESIVAQAVEANTTILRQQLEKAQKEAKDDLAKLTALTAEQKKLYEEQIAKATTPEEAKKVVEEAKRQNESNISYEFKLYKDTMKEAVDQLDELTYLERKEFKQDIDKAQTKDEVQSIFAKAQKKNTDNAVNKAIDIATKTIAGLTSLTQTQRDTFTRQVKEADSVSEVNAIVEKAKRQQQENEAKKEEAKKPVLTKATSYIHFTKDNYTLWKDLEFKAKKGSTKKYMNQTLKMKGYYVVDGKKYATIYNNDDQWLGYVNMASVAQDKNAGGKYYSYNRYVTVTKDNYTLWKDLDFKAKKGNTKSMKNHTYLVKGYYKHFNGSTYYSIYDKDNNWKGYVNDSATKLGKEDGKQKVGIFQSVAKTKKVVKKDYTLWKDLDFKAKKGNTKSIYNKKVYVSGQYEHISGSKYYSVYDKKGGKWLGYVNSSALK